MFLIGIHYASYTVMGWRTCRCQKTHKSTSEMEKVFNKYISNNKKLLLNNTFVSNIGKKLSECLLQHNLYIIIVSMRG